MSKDQALKNIDKSRTIMIIANLLSTILFVTAYAMTDEILLLVAAALTLIGLVLAFVLTARMKEKYRKILENDRKN